MSYVFFIKRVSDFDHLLPLAVKLISNGTPSQEIDIYEIFPDIKGVELQHLWTGRVALTLDHVPHIHKLADGIFCGLGFNGRGVAMTTTFGKILARHNYRMG